MRLFRAPSSHHAIQTMRARVSRELLSHKLADGYPSTIRPMLGIKIVEGQQTPTAALGRQLMSLLLKQGGKIYEGHHPHSASTTHIILRVEDANSAQRAETIAKLQTIFKNWPRVTIEDASYRAALASQINSLRPQR